MTREETKEAIRIMQAYVDGKEIICEPYDCGMGTKVANPSWNWGENIYRIAPDQEPKEKHYRPYTMEEFVEEMHKHDGFIRPQNSQYYGDRVTTITCGSCGIDNYYKDFSSLCDRYVWSDNGQQCGKEVAE